jgi:hypothetical protein
MINDIKKEAEQRMQRGIEALKEEMKRLRTGRAHAGLLEQVSVEYYGTTVPVKQTANISVEDARTLVVTPWEKNAGLRRTEGRLGIQRRRTQRRHEQSQRESQSDDAGHQSRFPFEP